MSEDFEIYKQNRKKELYIKYNELINKLQTDTISKINSVPKINSRKRQITINNLIKIYYTNINNLKKELNSILLSINNYTPEFIVKSGEFTNKKALLIGINYTNTPYRLNGCIDDAVRMNNFMQNRGFNEITMLTDLTTIKPTKANILNELKKLLINSNKNDLLYFYFSGHGSWTYDNNNEETDGRDEMIVSLDMLGVLDDEIKTVIDDNMKDNVTLVCLFDSCHSGTMCDLKFNYLDSNNYDKYTENPNANECKGNVIMISGCIDNQTSAEAIINNTPQGAVSWSFEKSINENPDCSWRELLLKMRSNLKEKGFSQIPQMSTDSFYNINEKLFI